KPLEITVEAVGTVAYDETRLAVVNPKIEGWVEGLFVDFTGAPVTRGQPLMSIYSPRLVSAQEELVLAARLVRESSGERALENARNLLEAARRRLAYWDVPDEQIHRLERTGEVSKALTLHSPASGIVVEKNVVEGDRIMPGMTVYRIADLSTVWIEADVYEKDLSLVREGQEGVARFEAHPGRSFRGRVTYVYPTVSLQARTGRVRLELPNPGLTLKPGMYARVELDIPSAAPTLVVPRSALLDTGRRTMVFVASSDGALVPRDVVPGRSVGREIEVLEGLDAGDRVVSSAAFLVDAESNLGTLQEGGMEMGNDPSGGTDDGGAPTGGQGGQGEAGSHDGAGH
ncbi:MAG: efflux RND transporter periplasmic adaptor subunit, partial [Gemmatimonadetes bacterium]|nr:efflux RND transporter periplasmic adaptor subunit [Gemmatimonadota bacterium]NIR78904.1 efflux RND transporter periplasmic adaptor subunit [Gemmatimonadota bacterium]NIT87539.1 efflux RND transporter periplasmic adaptor subunit [Gemmatimonadota bacterium]NIU31407.1 efflux RND transporter periplasmic adaptor subunit [Gemmatimonadota bacterium]NIU36092.1 efflux RND transporter periplasmic adaptor subunit [Gemmatimonadota bacterium]